MRIKTWLLLSLLAGTLFAQDGKLYVLTYKFKEGDKDRMSVTIYRNASIRSAAYQRATITETGYDLFCEVLEYDDQSRYKISIEPQLTRYTVNGQNLTYKMITAMDDKTLVVRCDRFGNMSIRPETIFGDSSWAMPAVRSLAKASSFGLKLPDHPVHVGDTWTLGTAESFLTMLPEGLRRIEPRAESQIKLESVDQGVASIAANVQFLGQGMFRSQADSVAIDYVIESDARYRFDIGKGRLLDGSITITVTGAGRYRNETIDIIENQSVTLISEEY